MSVQPVEPASPIRLLCKELPKVYVFSANKIFATFCASFSNRKNFLIEFSISFQDSGYALCLCAVLIADINPRGPCVPRSLEVGNTFLIAIFKQNIKNVFRVERFHTVTLFPFDFSFNFWKSLLATLYVACSFFPA